MPNPVGPSGSWTMVFEDQFTGTSLDTNRWMAVDGAYGSSSSFQVSVSGGYCQLLVGGMINTQPSLQGWGANPPNGPLLRVGYCCEARINFPGPSGDTAYNWPAWWTSGANWPANGECDIFESYNGTPSALNYHSQSGTYNGPFPSGNWCNSFHTYTLVRGSGDNGLKCYWDGVLVRQTGADDAGGPHSLIVFAGGGNTPSSLPILVDYVRMWTPGGAGPPVITTSSLPGGVIGTAYSATLAATAGTTPYAWSISTGTLPSWAGFNSTSGAISGTPNAAATTSFTAKVTDAAAQTATQPLSITVTASNVPVITTTSLPSGTQGTAYSATLAAAGGTPAYTWSISAGSLPSWASLNTSTGAITGTPDTAATTSFTAKVTDAASHTATQDLSLTVTVPGTSGGGQTLAFSQSLTSVTGGTLTTSSFTPATNDIIVVKAVTENSNVNTIIAGTPSGGGWTYTQRVKDETVNTTSCYIWTAPVTTGGTSQTVSLAGPTYSGGHWLMTAELWRGAQLASSPATCDVLGTGAPSATLTTAAANSVVSWGCGDFNGVTGTTAYRSGATEEGNQQASAYACAYTAWQSAGAAGAQTLGMTAPGGQDFAIVGIEIQARLAVTTTSLPGGQAGGLYSATLSASGGTAPYTWSISSGSLPSWAALNGATGVISGSKNVTAGTTSFTVQATDANGLTATQALSITITAVASGAAFVQVAGTLTTTGTTAASTIVIPVTATTTAGNALIAWCRIAGSQAGAAIRSVADSQGNSWTIDNDQISAASGDGAGVMSAILVTPLASGDTITITLSGSYQWRAAAVAEFSGVAADASNHTISDLSAWNDPATTSVTTTAGPSAQANELIISFSSSAHAQALTLTTADSSSGGTWVSLANPANSYLSAAYEIASAVHSFSVTWTVTGSTAGAGIVSYRAGTPAASGGSVTSKIQVSASVTGGPPTTSSGVTITPSATGFQSQPGAVTSGVTVTPSAAGNPVNGFTYFPGVNLPLKAELNLGGAWTDITQYVQLRNDVTITPGMGGRDNESSSIQSAQLTLTLRNDSGRFSPKNSSGAYYPYIARNTPIRISLNITSQTGVTYSGYRFSGEVSSWPPQWDPSGRDVYVSITASGIWRRISQATVTIGSAYARYVKLLTGVNVPAAYWAMEDGSGGGTGAASFVLSEGTGTNMIVTGQASFSADGASFGGSDALPQMNGARAAANVSSGATPTNNVTRFALSVPAAGDSGAITFSDGAVIATILSASATVKRTDIVLIANKLQINGYTSTAGGTPVFSGTAGTKVNGVPVLVSAEITPNSTSINWALRIIKPGAGTVLDQVSGSRASSTITAVTQVQLNPQGRLQDATTGQAGVFYSVPSLAGAAAALGGYAGETAVDRFTRICAESNIATEVIGSASAAMGPQTDKTISEVLQEIEDTDGGRLFESRSQLGLGYRTLASMKDQSVRAILNYSAQQVSPPLNPVYDDQLIRNDWVVTNYDGYAVEAVLTSGAISVQPPPNGIGTGYSGSKTVNANTHAQVSAIAQQMLFEGCVDDVRYPVVTANLAAPGAAPLFAAVAGLRIGDYFQVTNLPAFVGGGTSRQLVAGYTETMNVNTWTIAINGMPEAPWESGFSPGTFSVTQAPAGSVAAGAPVGSSVAGSQIGPGSIQANQLSNVISARTAGGNISFIAAATPYDWSFAVSGTPADATYFIAAEEQAAAINVGDTFTNSALGPAPGTLSGPPTTGPAPGFTVTSVAPPSGGNVSVYFTPDASAVMSSGTVYGGKNGDTWINTSAGNQVNQWVNGTWVPIVWNASSVIAASSITAGLVAAGQVIAGVVDGTTIQGATIIADGASGEVLVYSGTPATGNLIGSWSGAPGNDGVAGGGNPFPKGLAVEQGGLVLYDQATKPAPVSGAGQIYMIGSRMRYLASSGADLVLDRSAINRSNFSMGTQTTAQVMSGALLYLANEAVVGSEYEIEIDGTITTPSSTTTSLPVYNFSLFVDGSGFGANNVTFGTVFLSSNLTVAYTVRFRLTVNTTGPAGKADVIADGGASIQLNGASQFNLGNYSPSHTGGGTGQGSTPVNQVTTNVTFDTTANHSVAIYGNWGTSSGTSLNQSAITYRTKITRRN